MNRLVAAPTLARTAVPRGAPVAIAFLVGTLLLPITTSAQNSAEATAAAQRVRATRAAASAPAPQAAASSGAGQATSGKTASGKAAAAKKTVSPPPPAAEAAFDPGALAACKNDAGLNLVKRERCVYTHCKGHWGEGDCPPGSDIPNKDSMKEGFRNPFRKPDPSAQGR